MYVVLKGLGLVILLAVLFAGCRQPDGALPAPQGEQPNKITDISRDLQNVARKEAGAENDLFDDLDGLDPTPRPERALRQLSSAVAAAVSGRSVSDAQAQALAQQLFVVVTGRELSNRQIEQASASLRQAVLDVGADAAAADHVASAASALATEVTTNRERWYHFF